MVDKRVAYRNMDATADLEALINDRLEKVANLLKTEKTPQYLDFVLTAHHSGVLYKAELNTTTPDYKLYTQSEGHDMYKQIDESIDTMVDQIRKAKSKESDHRKKKDYFRSA
jgi:ribosomal subunit interface protein